MPRRLLLTLGAILLLVSVTLIVWLGSFSGSFGSFMPEDPDVTFVVYGVSTIIFLVFVYLGFMLVRMIWKVWIERTSDRPGSRIKTKLVMGALMLSAMPVFFMVFFSIYVLNNSMAKWFGQPVQHELVDFARISRALSRRLWTRQTRKPNSSPRPRKPATCLPAARRIRRGWLSSVARAGSWPRLSPDPIKGRSRPSGKCPAQPTPPLPPQRRFQTWVLFGSP